MHIYIDESGTFIPGSPAGSWCVVAAYVVPERSRRKAEAVLSKAKVAIGGVATREYKLKDFSEKHYANFLSDLGRLEGILYCTATDASAQTVADVKHHLARQVEGITKHKSKLIHEVVRSGVQNLADRFAKLSPQLYLQLTAQFDLVFRVIGSTSLYFAQRLPSALGNFRWRTDEKNEGVSVFENSFRDFAAPMNQAKSIDDPQIALIGADYSHFEKFRLKNGIPTYFKDVYGLELESGFDVGKVMRDDFAFVDSKSSPGVQIVDLLSSGIRRCLRGEFTDNDGIATALGRLMVQWRKGEFPIHLFSLGTTGFTTGAAERAVRIFERTERAMLIKDVRSVLRRK
jgi:hypothetical protein